MAKKTKRRRRNKFTLPLTVAGPIVLTGLNAVQKAQEMNSITWGAAELGATLTGYHPLVADKWSFGRLKKGLIPILFGAGAHKLANAFGINRFLARAGVPIIRI